MKRNAHGMINVVRIDHDQKEKTHVPYRRRDYYKVMLATGHYKLQYADKSILVKGTVLSFSNPKIPYRVEFLSNELQAIYCLFNDDFIGPYAHLDQYPCFSSQGIPVYPLDQQQANSARHILEDLEQELNSDYMYKEERMRNLIQELIHIALRSSPANHHPMDSSKASEHISTAFQELLERQFPIDEPYHTIGLTKPSDFAQQLNVHVNHLNKSVKEQYGKTTSQLIQERMFLEAKELLKYSSWTISQISYALGFSEPNYFTKAFKKQYGEAPSEVRKSN